jgi:hypothetical protein
VSHVRVHSYLYSFTYLYSSPAQPEDVFETNYLWYRTSAAIDSYMEEQETKNKEEAAVETAEGKQKEAEDGHEAEAEVQVREERACVFVCGLDIVYVLLVCMRVPTPGSCTHISPIHTHIHTHTHMRSHATQVVPEFEEKFFVPREWKSMGSDKDVDLLTVKNSRPFQLGFSMSQARFKFGKQVRMCECVCVSVCVSVYV